ncbi:transporter [Bacillus subtilis]|nr:transporter [Bacillus subtilis]
MRRSTTVGTCLAGFLYQHTPFRYVTRFCFILPSALCQTNSKAGKR